jgi:hypothetical protein
MFFFPFFFKRNQTVGTRKTPGSSVTQQPLKRVIWQKDGLYFQVPTSLRPRHDMITALAKERTTRGILADHSTPRTCQLTCLSGNPLRNAQSADPLGGVGGDGDGDGETYARTRFTYFTRSCFCLAD